MRNFLKKWFLLILAVLLLTGMLLYWTFKARDEVIGAFILTYYILFPLLSLLTTLWACRNLTSNLRYFTCLLFLFLGNFWVILF